MDDRKQRLERDPSSDTDAVRKRWMARIRAGDVTPDQGIEGLLRDTRGAALPQVRNTPYVQNKIKEGLGEAARLGTSESDLRELAVLSYSLKTGREQQLIRRASKRGRSNIYSALACYEAQHGS